MSFQVNKVHKPKKKKKKEFKSCKQIGMVKKSKSHAINIKSKKIKRSASKGKKYTICINQLLLT